MNRCLPRYFVPTAVLIISLSILIGCTATTSSSQPAVSPTQATLTALAIPVHVSGVNSTETALKKDETVVIQVNDAIVAPENGHGVVRFGDRLVVDILRGTDFSLSDVKLEPGDALFAKLKQVKGHTRVSLRDNANARVRLETDFASITTLRPGTEYLVCHDPTLLTCLVVLKGEVEVVGQGKVVTVRGGEGTYILKDKPPFPPICAHIEDVNAWLDKQLGTGDVPALGELVAGWPQESCAAATAKASVSAGTTQLLPRSEGMAKIEAGTYAVGSTASDEFHVAPLQKKLPTFWIDSHEVTNAQYKLFLDQTGHPKPSSWPGQDKHPVKGVTWDDAVAYCAWTNKRLPTEAEWEVAARGPGPNPPLYPWGSDPEDGGKVDYLPRTETYEVGSVDFNKSPFGVYDMAGNVWEWVGDPYYPVSEGMRIVRGGRYGLTRDMAYRQQAEPKSERLVPFTGFRCAADQVEGGQQ
jgi:formylglycine-generating enzyme required for sulfatase activity